MVLKSKNTIARNKAWNKVFSYAQRFPIFYSALLIPVAVLGYAYLLFFPFLFLLGIGKIIQIIATTSIVQIGAQLGSITFWFGAVLLSAITTLQISRIKFQPPEGINITPSTAFNLHQLLQKSELEIEIPKIDRIIITEQLSIDIAKTPLYPLPVWSTNTLVVGLPLMQCLSPEYFKCAVIRKLIQHSKHTHFVYKWLCQLRSTWALYANYFWLPSNKNNILLSGFFGIYAPLYRHLSVPIANQVELLADQDALDVINDEDLLQTIEKILISKIYLENKYWPKIKSMIEHNRYKLIEPYSKLELVLKNGLTPNLSKQWLDTLYHNQSKKVLPVPDLRSRMHNIGRNKIRIPEKTLESAAHYYLDKAYSDIISEINHVWLLRSNKLNDITKPLTQKATRVNSVSEKNTRLSTGLFN